MEQVVTAHPTQLAFAAACADVHRTDSFALGGASKERAGISYLIHPDWAVTAASVVRGLHPGQSVRLRFSRVEHRARLFASEPESDCALLRFEQPVRDHVPLLLYSGQPQPGASWQTWAAAPTLRSPGQVVSGLIHEPLGEDPLRGPAMVLKVLSGTSFFQDNLAGAPVLYNGRIIGHLRGRHPEDPQGLLGCPTTQVQAMLLLSLPGGTVSPGPAVEPRELVDPAEFMQPPKAPYSRRFYIARPELEDRALAYLTEPGRPLVLWAPERHGKTWLLERLLDQLCGHSGESPRAGSGANILRLNFERLAAEAYTGLEAFQQEIASQLTAQFASHPEAGRDATSAALRAWRSAEDPSERLAALFGEVLLPRTRGLLFLALDRVDGLREVPFIDPLLTALRSFLDRARSAATGWQRLRLILCSSLEPRWLVRHPGRSPFTLAPPLELPDLSLAALDALAQLHGLSFSAAELAQLAALIGGHPYLARLAMYAAATRGLRMEQLTSAARPGAQVFDGFLETCRQRLMAQPGLWPTAERALSGKPLGDIDRLLLPRLASMGLIRHEGETCAPRYPLFKRLLGL